MKAAQVFSTAYPLVLTCGQRVIDMELDHAILYCGKKMANTVKEIN